MTTRPLRPPRRPAAAPAVRAVAPQAGTPVLPSRSRLRPLGVDEVRIDGGVWHRLQETNAAATLGHVEYWLEREGWLANFDLAAAGADMSRRRGREFSDSEVYKLLEAMAWELGRSPDAGLARRFEALVARVAAAQEADGYLGTRFGRRGQQPRYSDLEWGHELYCLGHLMQAAVARVRTGHPDDLLVRVARRAADHVCLTFGAGGLQGICGHAEVEVALSELGRATGVAAYTEQAALFVERRGHGTLADIEFGRAYFQDDEPVREAAVFRGHAVRANYLAAGAVDVAVDQDDDELLAAIERQWQATQARRTYLTGGQGSRHQDEGFGDDFVLPPDRAYSETCAAVASNMVSWRLLLRTGRPRYADAIERTLFNVVATSPSEDGRAFYYANTLHQRVPGEAADPDHASERALSSLRAPWFDVSCCPPNVARTLAALGTTFATVDDTGVQLHQYAGLRVTAEIGDEPVALRVETDYPSSGQVEVTVERAPAAGVEVTLRVPDWADSATVDGTPAEPGAFRLPAPVHAGDVVRLDLDPRPRFVRADHRVDAVRGCVAVERGPEVWCLESVDLPSSGGEPADLGRVRVLTDAEPRWEDDRVVVRVRLLPPGSDAAWPYRAVPVGQAGRAADDDGLGEVLDVPLTRYRQWASRGPSTMRVWIPVAEGRAR